MDMKENLFANIVDLAQIGYWEIDMATGTVDASDYFWDILGYKKGDLESTLDNLKKIHEPSDWEQGWELIAKLLKKEIPIYVNRVRYLTKDNKWLLCEVKGVVSEWTEAGEAKTFIGFIRDISLEIKMEKLLLDQKDRQTELDDAQDKINELAGIIPICSKCKNIRNDNGYWKTLEAYIEKHSNVVFSHGICEHCLETLYKDKGWFKKYKDNLNKKADESRFGENI